MDLDRIIKNRRVALVGCSSNIRDSSLGSTIDEYDVVVRCDDNWPNQNQIDVGTRTDLLFHHTQSCDMEKFCFYPIVSAVVWFGEKISIHKANRFLDVMEIPHCHISQHPHDLTATNALDVILSYDPIQIYIAGCDFCSPSNEDKKWVRKNLLFNTKVVMADHVQSALASILL